MDNHQPNIRDLDGSLVFVLNFFSWLVMFVHPELWLEMSKTKHFAPTKLQATKI